MVAIAAQDGKVLHVKDLLELKDIASPATLHKAVSNLVDKGMIDLKVAEQDGRVKEVRLTKLANKRYEDLGRVIEMAVNNKISQK